jgi:alcohol dehydrogenase
VIAPFAISRLPRIEFGAGSFSKLPAIASGYGRTLLLVVGGNSLERSPNWEPLLETLRGNGSVCHILRVRSEPSPELVDTAVAEWRSSSIDVVVGIGGGSVLDAAKAIAGLLKPGNSVMDHLEGIGPELPYLGPATPFIAVPTTAGTGSEATKNAVLSRHGPDGFKKSFRDDKLMAEVAILDPDLLATCPPELIAANGMDAFTQLLESYVSLRSNPVTDALAMTGMSAARTGLLDWDRRGANASEARGKMALASMLSGICLAQTGLGSVHGLAQPLGSFFPIPHGVVCGTLVAAATRVNVDVMRSRDPGNPALAKYAEVGKLFGGEAKDESPDPIDRLLSALEEWTRTMELPTLSSLGVSERDFPNIIAHCRGSSMKTNPVVLSDEEVRGLLAARLE